MKSARHALRLLSLVSGLWSMVLFTGCTTTPTPRDGSITLPPPPPIRY